MSDYGTVEYLCVLCAKILSLCFTVIEYQYFVSAFTKHHALDVFSYQ